MNAEQFLNLKVGDRVKLGNRTNTITDIDEAYDFSAQTPTAVNWCVYLDDGSSLMLEDEGIEQCEVVEGI